MNDINSYIRIQILLNSLQGKLFCGVGELDGFI